MTNDIDLNALDRDALLALVRSERAMREVAEKRAAEYASIAAAMEGVTAEDLLGADWFARGVSVESLGRVTRALNRLAAALRAQDEPKREPAPFGHISRANECQVEHVDVCGKRCDHGSECLELPGHPGGHETQHGCVFYDEEPKREPSGGAS